MQKTCQLESKEIYIIYTKKKCIKKNSKWDIDDREETIKKRQMGGIGSQSMASQEIYNQNSQDKFSPDLSDYTQNEKEGLSVEIK